MSAQLVEPACTQWSDWLAQRSAGHLLGRPLAAWRRETRGEVGLATDRPIVATGHQTLLWHPGILAKYLAVEAFRRRHPNVAVANLIVDQHAGGFGSFDVPVRRRDGSLAVRTFELTTQRPDVPMAMHEAFTPPRPPQDLPVALPSVQFGIERIFGAVYDHRDAPNAAMQMAAALADLMQPWVGPIPGVTATQLLGTSLGRSLLEAMVADPRRCAAAYNDAVAAVPEAGIGPLLIRDDYVELPLWRLRPDGRRMRAYDSDVQAWLEGGATTAPPLRLMPRALLLTALVRVGMCDLFIHGTGGATYDRAMEMWIKGWLGVVAAPVAVVTATLRLPLGASPAEPIDVRRALAAARRAWHDPESLAQGSPGPVKRGLLAEIESLPRRSQARKALFFEMHEKIAQLRREHDAAVREARERAATAARRAREAPIADRRTWTFVLYPPAMIDELAAAIDAAVAGEDAGSGVGAATAGGG
ncbi:MAG: hypothetical protein ACYSTY_00200 [Planctomycetota bacterium]